MNQDSVQPIILIGMHRSGTSMITRMLEQGGLFMGKKKQGDDEAEYFLKLNSWLLNSSSAEWDNPSPFRYLLNNEAARSVYEDYLGHIVETRNISSYLGFSGYLRYKSLKNLNFPWGWKDPRTTYTLPLWLKIFPGAKIVHIYRNGVDVANSLVERAKQEIDIAKNLHEKRKRQGLYQLKMKERAFSGSHRCAQLTDAFNLWDEYVKEAQAAIESTQNETFVIRYEDFLLNPISNAKNLFDFCGMDRSESSIVELTKAFNKGRAFAYKRNGELESFFESVKDRETLVNLGYV